MSFQGSTSLKWFKRLKIYKNSTGTTGFDPATNEGFSYRWSFCQEVNGKIVFNDYNWSNTTNGHQSAVRATLRELGRSYICINAGRCEPRSISRSTVESMWSDYYYSVASDEHYNHRFPNRHPRSSNYQLENILKLETVKREFIIGARRKRELELESQEKFINNFQEPLSESCFKYLSLRRAETELNEINLDEVLP